MSQFTHRSKSVSRLLTPVAFALVLGGCSIANPYLNKTDINISQPATDHATNYLLKAESSGGSESIDWNILALKAFLQEGQWHQAEKQSQRIAQETLSPIQNIEWQLSTAYLYQQLQQPKKALSQLNFESWWQVTPQQFQRYYELKAALYESTQQFILAATARTALNQYLSTAARTTNWQQVWSDISRLNNTQLQAANINPDNTVLRGWIQLAMLKNTFANNPVKLKSMVQEWLSTHPYHPAHDAMPSEITRIMNMDLSQPKNIALLLPLSGKYEAQGKAVRNGFVDAMMKNPERSNDEKLTIYDTQSKSMTDIMAKMKQAKIDFIIGPLTKSKIVELQNIDQDDIPMLALNEPSTLNTQTNTCYFSLSPEQEAQQSAQHIFTSGMHYPLVLVPNSGFGKRVGNAFIEQWKKLTGRTPELKYIGSPNQYQKELANIFGLNASKTRIQQMQRLLGSNVKGESRSRRDIDAVYVIANKTDLALLKPSIEVTLNPGIKSPQLFTSARSNPGDNRQMNEISGIQFNDIPLIVSPTPTEQADRQKLWTNQGNGEIRLHAFGMDAYSLINQLPKMRVLNQHTFDGQTGQLSINNQCIVQRQLEWAIFTPNGVQATH